MIGSLVIGLLGAALTLGILWDAFETVLVPRRIGRRFRLTRYFYMHSWWAWRGLARRIGHPPRREALLGFYGPLSVIVLEMFWAIGLITGFALLQAAANAAAQVPAEHFGRLLYMSGETFFTLGYGDITPATRLGRFYAVVEAGLGFGFLGTVVGYLPTFYAAFSQREIEISLLDQRAGSPPTAAELLTRGLTFREQGPGDETLREWERWSAQLLETHVSYPQLAYYRSQHLNQSWLAALVSILDCCAVILARRDESTTRQAQLTFAMARHALVDVTQLFVRVYRADAHDRLPPEELARLRERLARDRVYLPETPEFDERLRSLRVLYEPYAKALAEHLLFVLPPWVHGEARRDNWRGGPWDKLLASATLPDHSAEEHF